MEDEWLEAMAVVRDEFDAQTRDEAVELYVAEAARMHLRDRRGRARMILRSGTVLSGDLVPGTVPDMLTLVDPQGRTVLVPVTAVLRILGTESRLHPEQVRQPGHDHRPGHARARERTLASVLRDSWSTGERVRALGADGTWLEGPLRLVAADHAVLAVGAEPTVLPFGSVDAWLLAT